MDDKTRMVPVTLPNGAQLQVEATELGAEGFESLSYDTHKFEGVIGAIEGIAIAVQNALEKVRPNKASIEMGLEVGVEAGKLTALLVKGAAKANLKVTLYWDGGAAR